MSQILHGSITQDRSLSCMTRWLEPMLELENRLLTECEDDEYLLEDALTDIEKARALDIIRDNLILSRNELGKYRKRLIEVADRIQVIENEYQRYHTVIANSMKNRYYGKANDGREVWAEGKPPSAEETKKETPIQSSLF